MIKRGRNDVKQTYVDNNFGGSGRMYITQFLGKDSALGQVPGFPNDFDSTLNFMHELILEPGARIGEHTHNGSEEIYFIVEGLGEIVIDGISYPVKEGDAILTKNKSSHSFKVTGEKPVKMFVVEAEVK